MRIGKLEFEEHNHGRYKADQFRSSQQRNVNPYLKDSIEELQRRFDSQQRETDDLKQSLSYNK